MIGASDIATCLRPNGDFDELAGITPRAVSELFRLLNERTAQVEFEVEVQMFQLYRDGLDDLLADPKKKKDSAPQPLKIVLAEHSSTGLVQVLFAGHFKMKNQYSHFNFVRSKEQSQ